MKILSEGLPQNEVSQELIKAHFRPRAQLKEGVWLARQPGVHAMMDISDGVASDIQRIMEESYCGAHIEVDLLPTSENLRKASAQFGWQTEDLALTAGEDYCLLVTIDPKNYDALKTAYFNQFHQPLHTLGKILPGSDLIYTLNKQTFLPTRSGFDHFKSY